MPTEDNRAAGTPGYRGASSTSSRRSKPPDGTSSSTIPVHLRPAVPLEQLTPVDGRVRDRALHGHRHGEVTANVDPDRPQARLPRDPLTSGCEAADFAGIDCSGTHIALIQRGTCEFGVKATNARPPAPRRSSSSTRATRTGASLIVGTLVGQPDAVEHPGRGRELRPGRRAVAGRDRPRRSWSPQPESRR